MVCYSCWLSMVYHSALTKLLFLVRASVDHFWRNCFCVFFDDSEQSHPRRQTNYLFCRSVNVACMDAENLEKTISRSLPRATRWPALRKGSGDAYKHETSVFQGLSACLRNHATSVHRIALSATRSASSTWLEMISFTNTVWNSSEIQSFIIVMNWSLSYILILAVVQSLLS